MHIMRTPSSFLTWTSVLAAWLAIAGPVAAQEDDAPASQPTQEDCSIEPDEPGTEPAPGDDELSSKLDDCNGVLDPPSVGDPDIVEPTPHVGRTPVIRPEQIPEQENDNSL